MTETKQNNKKEKKVTKSPIEILADSITMLKRATSQHTRSVDKGNVLQKEIQVHCEKFTKKGDKLFTEFNKQVKALESRLENFEDSLFHIVHNIKKNQFLYSHYPEEWVKNYLDIKEGVKFENEYMEKKIKNET